jgi:pyrimidine-nucleoside phosphorylase
MSAFLMAAFLNGLDEAESAALTRAMLHSGVVVDLSEIEGRKVDKHSTGGVGDKISLCLAPLVAACGVAVPMISGRGLGHSGGTLDKLESIPGFRTDLSLQAFRDQVATLGVAMIGQTDEIAPADRKIYALRDVTGTVEYEPFITASVMSKKLAEGIDGLVLDVKCGVGAFMTTREEAERLAAMLVKTGEQFEKSTVALLTRMDNPLGYAVGNWPEVFEAVRVLRGEYIPDVSDLTLALAGEMLHLGGVADSPSAGRSQAARALADGRAYDKFVELVLVQGGDPWALDSHRHYDTGERDVIYEGEPGILQSIDARAIGWASVSIGAGRSSLGDAVDPGAGIEFHKRAGDSLAPGERVATIYSNKTNETEEAIESIRRALAVSGDPVPAEPIILGRCTAEGWTKYDTV